MEKPHSVYNTKNWWHIISCIFSLTTQFKLSGYVEEKKKKKKKKKKVIFVLGYFLLLLF
jgi:hypothetical protein